MYDLIIIGAGPAGLSAGIYAVSRGKKVLVLENKHIGGVISKVSTVTHYLGALVNESGADFARRMQKQAEHCGLLIHKEQVTRVHLQGEIKEVFTEKNQYSARKVIIANGSRPRDLHICGQEALAHRYYGLNAVESAKDWVGKSVYIIGAGDGAIKEAIYLSNFAKEVTVLNKTEHLTCVAEFQEKVSKLANVKIWKQVVVQKLYGVDKLQAFDLLHLDSGVVEKISAIDSAIFTYVGSIPNSDIYQELQLENGYIKTDEDMQTNIEGVFAAGDIRVKRVRQIATAVSDGTVAATVACSQL